MSGTIGATRLAALCADLESHAGRGERPVALVESVQDEFSHVRDALETEIRLSAGRAS